MYEPAKASQRQALPGSCPRSVLWADGYHCFGTHTTHGDKRHGAQGTRLTGHTRLFRLPCCLRRSDKIGLHKRAKRPDASARNGSYSVLAHIRRILEMVKPHYRFSLMTGIWVLQNWKRFFPEFPMTLKSNK